MTVASPLVSVILPAYNCAKYLPEAIDSILSQTLDDFELLIIYDDSKDATLDIIEKYAQKDQRVQLVHGKKERLVGALNLGLSVSRGQFIARMDADDVSLPERFQKQVGLMISQNLDVCGTHMLMMNESGRLLESVVMPVNDDQFAITLACTVPFAHGSVMMRNEFMQKHAFQYQTGQHVEDYDLWCRLYGAGARFGNVNEFLFSYRHLSSSLSKVNAKNNRINTSAIRRNFVSSNLQKLSDAVNRLKTHQSMMSTRESVFLLLSAYMIALKTKSPSLLLEVIRQANPKSIGIAAAKVLNRF